jgi:hypothetical protein
MENIPADLWDELMAYYMLEPWGEERSDLRAGIIASTMANVMGNKSKPADFMPDFSSNHQPRNSKEEQFAELERLFGELRDAH